MTAKLQFSRECKKDVSSKNICLEMILHIELQLNFKILYICWLSILIYPANWNVSLAQNELQFIFFNRLSHLVASSTKIILIFTRIVALKAHGDKGHTVNVQHKWNYGYMKGYGHLLSSSAASEFHTSYCLLSIFFSMQAPYVSSSYYLTEEPWNTFTMPHILLNLLFETTYLHILILPWFFPR